MDKKKIVMLPLDERPCNFDYPRMMPKTDYELILPEKKFMGQKKIPGDTERIAQWLLEHVEDADVMILSLDTLIYGGIVPSRLHYESVEQLIQRADIIAELRKKNPNMKLYAFQLIMRCPTNSSSDEEPDYYEECGAAIHLYGKYSHMERLGILSEMDKADFERVKKAVKTEYLTDYLERREKNLSVLMHNLNYVKDGTIDYFIIPQDDAAVYGFTAIDQMTVREYLKSNILHKKTAMYPSADDTGLTLLARATTQLSGTKPKIYVKYSSSKGGNTIPMCEDRILDETIKYHILSAGGIQVYSLPEADMLLAVNVGSAMVGSSSKLECVKAYDIERNLTEFVTYIEYALDMEKIVAVGDVARLNKADTELTALMSKEGLLMKIHAYAGWNTSSNTLGTAICQGILYMIGRDSLGNRDFLLHRYYEDIGYMAYVRKYITQNILPDMGANPRCLGKHKEEIEVISRDVVKEYMLEQYPEMAEYVENITANMPWNRMFEIDLKLGMRN